MPASAPHHRGQHVQACRLLGVLVCVMLAGCTAPDEPSERCEKPKKKKCDRCGSKYFGESCPVTLCKSLDGCEPKAERCEGIVDDLANLCLKICEEHPRIRILVEKYVKNHDQDSNVDCGCSSRGVCSKHKPEVLVTKAEFESFKKRQEEFWKEALETIEAALTRMPSPPKGNKNLNGRGLVSFIPLWKRFKSLYLP